VAVPPIPPQREQTEVEKIDIQLSALAKQIRDIKKELDVILIQINDTKDRLVILERSLAYCRKEADIVELKEFMIMTSLVKDNDGLLTDGQIRLAKAQQRHDKTVCHLEQLKAHRATVMKATLHPGAKIIQFTPRKKNT